MYKTISTKRAALAACVGGACTSLLGFLLYLEGKQAGKHELVKESQERFMQAVQANGAADPSPSASEVATDLPGEPPVTEDEEPSPTAEPTVTEPEEV